MTVTSEHPRQGLSPDSTGRTSRSGKSNRLGLRVVATLTVVGLATVGIGASAAHAVDGINIATAGTYPVGIATDSAGNVYTANSGSDNVSKITPAGVSTILGTTGDAPRSIAVDSAGNVYTANITADNVSKITPAGVSTILGTTGDSPSSIAVDSAGNVYTANNLADNVSKITPAGVSTIFATVGDSPVAMVIDYAGTLFVANRLDENVSKVTSAGVSTILGGLDGTRPVGGAALDRFGNLFLTSQFDLVWMFPGVAAIPPSDNKEAQTIVGKCVTAPGSLKASGSTKLMKPGCETSAGQRVGVRVSSVKPRTDSRGDQRYYSLVCKVGNKTVKTKSAGYGNGSRKCSKGALNIRTYGTKLKLKVTWNAPATDTYKAYKKTKTLKS